MKNALLFICLFAILFFASQNLSAQEVHGSFKNFSFEDFPRPAIAPMGWFSYDFENQTPPDIHPCDPPVFGVKNKPYHGKSYLGLVTRANNTYESVTQMLKKSFSEKECYSFSIYLSQSPTYKSSVTWSPKKKMNFTAPTTLRIWGGNKDDDDIELLVETPAINHNDWKKYVLTFSPSKKIDHIIFEASFPNPAEPTNGHLLLDNLSPILKITCEIIDDEVRPSTTLGSNTIKELDLMTTVQETNGQISFNKNNELTSITKTSFTEIGAKLLENPKSKLIVYFVGENRKERKLRKNFISNSILALGYTSDMFEVLYYNSKLSSVTRKPWTLENNELLIDIGIR